MLDQVERYDRVDGIRREMGPDVKHVQASVLAVDSGFPAALQRRLKQVDPDGLRWLAREPGQRGAIATAHLQQRIGVSRCLSGARCRG